MGNRPDFVIVNGHKVITKQSHSSFRGRHNAVKGKILLMLYSRWQERDSDGLCNVELAKLTGESTLSLKTLLPKWLKWQYVKRGAKVFNDHPVFAYRIDSRGRKFIEQRMPVHKREELINEIKNVRREAF
jgi:hypothetical protein